MTQMTAAEMHVLLAAKIEWGIKRKGWSKGDFAILMKVHASVVSRWVSGKNNISIDTLLAIQNFLEIRLLDLDPPAPIPCRPCVFDIY